MHHAGDPGTHEGDGPAVPGGVGRSGLQCRPVPFITFEGIEGCGKTTQMRRLSADLSPAPIVTAEPGGTALGRKIRDLLLEPGSQRVASSSELLLFFADRAQHVEEVIVPALREGRTVLCDRFGDSTLAYQGFGRGLSREWISQLQSWAAQGVVPDLTILLDVPVDVGLGRAGRRGGPDRIEREEREFHERVRSGFLSLSREDARWCVVDGTAEESAVSDRVCAAVRERFATLGWRA
jgi:dTMP kinase